MIRPTLMLATLFASQLALAQEPVEEPAPEPVVEPAPAAVATTYALSAAKSTLFVVIRNDESALMSRLGHDHVISASAFTGEVTWHPEDASQCKIDIDVPVASLQVDPGTSRDRAGLDDNTISDSDKDKLRKNMLSKSQLDGSSFSSVRFTSTSCSATEGKVVVKGDMGIRGVTKAITVTMDVSHDGSQFRAKGHFSLTTHDFGFKPFSALAGSLKNQAGLQFVVDLKGSSI